jgi:hypothetical protein
MKFLMMGCNLQNVSAQINDDNWCNCWCWQSMQVSKLIIDANINDQCWQLMQTPMLTINVESWFSIHKLILIVDAQVNKNNWWWQSMHKATTTISKDNKLQQQTLQRWHSRLDNHYT